MDENKPINQGGTGIGQGNRKLEKLGSELEGLGKKAQEELANNPQPVAQEYSQATSQTPPPPEPTVQNQENTSQPATKPKKISSGLGIILVFPF